MNDDVQDLIERLSRAINETLMDSEPILDLMSDLECAIGNFRISVDLILPDTEASKEPSEEEPAVYDELFLRGLKIEP